VGLAQPPDDVVVAAPSRGDGRIGGAAQYKSANDVLGSLVKKDFFAKAQATKWSERLAALQDLLKEMDAVPSLIQLLQRNPQLNVQTEVVSSASVAPLRDLMNVLKDLLKDTDVRVCASAASVVGRVLRSVGRSIGSRLERRLLVTLLIGSLNHRSKVVLQQVQTALNDAVGNCIWVAEVMSEISVGTDASEVKSATARAAMYDFVAQALQFEALHGHPSSHAYPNLAIVLKRAISDRDRDSNTRNAAERGLAALVAAVEHLASQSSVQRDPFAHLDEGKSGKPSSSSSHDKKSRLVVRAQSAGSVKHHHHHQTNIASRNMVGSHTPQGKDKDTAVLKRPNSLADMAEHTRADAQCSPKGTLKIVLDQLKADNLKAVQRVESMAQDMLSQINTKQQTDETGAEQERQKENTYRQEKKTSSNANASDLDPSKRRLVRRVTGGTVGDMGDDSGTPSTTARPPRAVSSRGFDDDSSSTQRSNPNPRAGAKVQGSSTAINKDELETMWFELKYLLPSNRRVESKHDIELLSSDLKCAHHFLDEVESIAKQAGSLQGAVSRWVMPYDDNTSTLDQAASSRRATQEKETGDGQRFIKFAGGSAGKERLVSGAVALRHLVRVKLADDADLDQARQAVGHVSNFIHSLKRYAKATNEDVSHVLKDLKL
jgi:hypothetical protein